MTRVFVTQPIPPAAVARLRAAADVRIYPDAARILPYDELLAEITTCDVLYCLLHDRVDREAIEAGRALKMIATSAINPANVDVVTATSRRIPVTVIPNIVAEDTADLQWGLLLAAARRIPEAERALKRHVFPGAQSMHFAGARVHGRTLGTIGLGAIGRAIARRAQGFGMRVLYTKRNRIPVDQEQTAGASYRSLDDLLRESDFVVINASYYPGTRHLIGARELNLMKPTAHLVNTARGPIVDERALADAVIAGRIAGAALDVYEREPQVLPDLLTLENVVLTPHIGTATRQMREEIAAIVVDNILAFLGGTRPPNICNPDVFA